MPKSIYKEAKGKKYHICGYTGRCGFICNARSEKAINTITRLHKKKCKICNSPDAVDIKTINNVIVKLDN